MNTIQQQLADRLYELLPHKKELEFGCEWKLNNDIWTYANGFSFIKNNKNSWSGVLPEKDVIIGQPLGIADIFSALSQKTHFDFFVQLFNDSKLVIKIAESMGDDEVNTWGESVVYNLSQDNILNQSDELCKLCLGLLNK